MELLSPCQDRRPLAPATVAKLVIKNEDQSLVNDECVIFLLCLLFSPSDPLAYKAI
jgi:hypothetical protein